MGVSTASSQLGSRVAHRVGAHVIHAGYFSRSPVCVIKANVYFFWLAEPVRKIRHRVLVRLHVEHLRTD